MSEKRKMTALALQVEERMGEALGYGDFVELRVRRQGCDDWVVALGYCADEYAEQNRKLWTSLGLAAVSILEVDE